MLLTRREICSGFPVGLLPALFSVEDPPARQSSLPRLCIRSTIYPFERRTMHSSGMSGTPEYDTKTCSRRQM
jgi:hypothetical protein